MLVQTKEPMLGNMMWTMWVISNNGNAIMAAIALVQLKYLDRDNARRREIVEMYNKGFENNSKIQIIRAPHADECSFHIYELIVSDREGLL